MEYPLCSQPIYIIIHNYFRMHSTLVAYTLVWFCGAHFIDLVTSCFSPGIRSVRVDAISGEMQRPNSVQKWTRCPGVTTQ